MAQAPAGNSAATDEVRRMFDRIAPVYDAMNTVMTAGVDARWRRAAIGAARLEPVMRALDVACGTGMLTRAAAARVAPNGEALGVDISEGMLARARRAAARDGVPLARYTVADALALPFDDERFDAVTVGFGLRNMPDYRAALAEMRRVARPGGRVVVLEIAVPERGPAHLLFRTWFERIVPRLGGAVGSGSAYRYLPTSVLAYPRPDAIAALMREVGLAPVRWRRLVTGMATLHVGRRA
jgi:demethylmenaquinone methyltransferase/2-methoxy-6-polyprenyl-1,4-benzoquinol methylase